MRVLLDQILKRFIVLGRLTVHWPGGSVSTYRGTPGPEAMIELCDSRTVARLALNPALSVGECYMEGGLVPLDCPIYDVLDVLIANKVAETSRNAFLKLHSAMRMLTRRIAQFNPVARARRNIAHHYDLNGRLYSLFLDRDRQYSCAYFPNGNESIDDAQIAKKRHIAAKLKLDRPNLSVLDVGCGWGGLALTLAREYGARVTGITLSTEQLAEAQARARAEELHHPVSFEMMDYRAMNGRFDRIVSVGMFEHVGVGHYQQFFDMIKRCLAPDGVALLHAIGRSDRPSATNPWIAKYIFPGSYCAALSEVLPPIEATGLITTEVEILRLHYAKTLRHWRHRFAANRDAIIDLYDERFCRMFEFYLASSELSFRRDHMMVFQIQLTRDQTAVPLTRDYIIDTERAAAAKARLNAA